MPTFDLELQQFIPGTPTTTGFAGIDAPNNRVVISQDDVPANGGKLEILVLFQYIRASQTNSIIRDQFAAAIRNGASGIVESLIKDESIVDVGTARNRAFHQLAISSQPNITVSFDTLENGWDLEQTFRFKDPIASPPIDIILIVQNIVMKLKSSTGIIDEWTYSITAAPYIIDPDALLAKAIKFIQNPPRQRLAQIGS